MKRTSIVVCCMLLCSFAFGQKKKFTGTFSNGYKGAKISFTLSDDKKKMEDVTFDGYWRCGSSIEHITAGPEKSVPVNNGQINGIITEPEGGGSSAFRFEITGAIKGNTASGTFRMSITGLGCDTYELKWTAATK
ncbi:hypothetical protein [Rubrolithibacter danxiaensis]|uniref:hypothetical protein n=1 Tax=Rubrolithibacter danxiaensis TaxID=3390805 RepID=UPI003BF852AE